MKKVIRIRTNTHDDDHDVKSKCLVPYLPWHERTLFMLEQILLIGPKIFVNVVMRPWYLHKMVSQNTVRTYGINQILRFVKGIWLTEKNFGKDLIYFI